MLRRLFICAAAGTLLAAPTRAAELQDPALILETVTGGFALPDQMQFFSPPALDDFIVLEQKTGKVQRSLAGVITTVLDLHVNSSIDHGLFGFAMHPDFSTNGWAYIYYTESNTGDDSTGLTEMAGNRLYRYTWNGASFDSPLLILDLPADPNVFHQGGLTLFGPDGKLYTTIGDQERRGVLQNIATGPPADNTSVIFRLNDDGSAPVDNPFITVPGYEKVYAYGVRNVFGLTFDPLTDVMWQTENGPEDMDEINLVLPGFNSGWLRLMGPEALGPNSQADLVVVPGSAYSDPEFSFQVARGINAIEFFTSTNLGPGYENDLFTCDVVFNNLYRFELNGARDGLVLAPPLDDLHADDETELSDVVFGSGFLQLTDIDTGPDGNLYLLERLPGRIVRVRHKTLDFHTTAEQLVVTCDPSGMTTVTGGYRIYGTGGGALVPSVELEFYLDDPMVPANLLASFTEVSPVNGTDVSHNFSFQWPDAQAHTIVMVVDRLDVSTEDLETNNQASWFEECLDFVVPIHETPFVESGGVRLHQNSPNPFNPSTELQFDLPAAGRASLIVYDLAGRVVKVLVDAELAAGAHLRRWDGRDTAGREVVSGVYLARLSSAGFAGSIRMVLAK